jgi:hypothetical protein
MHGGELRPADILLCHSDTPHARAIQLLDGTKYNHAALLLKGTTTGNADRTGLCRVSLSDLSAEELSIGVRRLSDNASLPSFAQAPVDLRLVVDSANRMLEQKCRFAYEQLFILAFLCVSRRVPIPGLDWATRLVLDRAAKELEDLIARAMRDGTEAMICSEFVFRAYSEGLPNIHLVSESDRQLMYDRAAEPYSLLAYALRHMPEGSLVEPRFEQAALGSEAEFELDLASRFEHVRPSDSGNIGWEPETVAKLVRMANRLRQAVRWPEQSPIADVKHLESVVADFVTPGDLARSAKLTDLGDLEGK